ncbi:CaiB/BaiF CoA transferase family protein [Halorarum salinum]|uniref:CoA transferase n=1 Tax=Halorarum salinum TaxID=2743089 RepID=A0A7D5QAE8_9EURY|nr:CaiB/BaiF CoA-transferase family protein [Halobaculum salinum]QLG60281.1 CoA transferase [Halobaculum salinum]
MSDLPLESLNVVELGHIVAGPYAGLILADLGADVVKVERPGHGDAMRNAGKSGSSMFHYLNRGKESVTVDLKTPEGKEAFLDLLESADVLLENYSPGMMERFGLGYEVLRERNPGLVYVSIKGYADGPYSDRVASDPIAEAMSGLMNMTGHQDSGPARAGTSIVDMNAAANAVISILVALRERERTGEGQYINAPLFEAAVSLMGYWIAYQQMFDEEPKRMGASHASQTPYDAYPTADDKYIFIGSTSDKHWHAIQDVLDISLPYESHHERLQNREEIDRTIENKTKESRRDELVEKMIDADVPCAPVNELADVIDDPHLEETGLFTTIDISGTENDAVETEINVPAFPVWSTGFDTTAEGSPPELGADTERVLRRIGHSDEKIQ